MEVRQRALFELLNQMEGLAEDEDLLFVLTTNRPDLIEPALAARPGRVDLALEIPLPGRRRAPAAAGPVRGRHRDRRRLSRSARRALRRRQRRVHQGAGPPGLAASRA